MWKYSAVSALHSWRMVSVSSNGFNVALKILLWTKLALGIWHASVFYEFLQIRMKKVNLSRKQSLAALLYETIDSFLMHKNCIFIFIYSTKMNPLSRPSIKLDKYILTYTINMNFDKKQTWCNDVPRLIHPLEWPHCLLQPDPLTGVSLLSQWSQFLWTLGCALSARFTPVTCEMRCTRLALFPSLLPSLSRPHWRVFLLWNVPDRLEGLCDRHSEGKRWLQAKNKLQPIRQKPVRLCAQQLPVCCFHGTVWLFTYNQKRAGM